METRTYTPTLHTHDFGDTAVAAVQLPDGDWFIATAYGNESNERGEVALDVNVAAEHDRFRTFKGARLANWSDCPDAVREDAEAFIDAYRNSNGQEG